MILFIAIAILFYLLIGILFSALWVKEAIRNIGVKNFDPLSYVIRCGFMWPFLISNKKER